MVLKVCIVIPMYNEEGHARRSLETILPYVRTLQHPTTVLVVNDGSQDRTALIVNEYIRKLDSADLLTMVSHGRNQGYGAALRTGMRYAIDYGYDWALFMDSDLTNHPKYLPPFYSKMSEGCEYIKATRYREGGGMRGVPWKRRMFSQIGNKVGGALFRLPLTDVTNGFRAVKVDILKKLDLHENGFPIIMEELVQVKQRVTSFCEVPYVLTERVQGQGATHFPYTVSTIRKYLSYALKGFLYARPK